MNTRRVVEKDLMLLPNMTVTIDQREGTFKVRKVIGQTCYCHKVDAPIGVESIPVHFHNLTIVPESGSSIVSTEKEEIPEKPDTFLGQVAQGKLGARLKTALFSISSECRDELVFIIEKAVMYRSMKPEEIKDLISEGGWKD